MCPADYRPVCGNDGRFYSNSCQANARGGGVRCSGGCPCNSFGGGGGGNRGGGGFNSGGGGGFNSGGFRSGNSNNGGRVLFFK